MTLTTTQTEVYSYCEQNDYISPTQEESFRQRLEREGNIQTLAFAMEKFISETCPRCGLTGEYKYHFFGRLRHPNCQWSWYVGPGTYIVVQLKGVFRTGMEAGAGMKEEYDKKGERGGWVGAIFGFIFGAIFRLIFAAIMVPIQAVVSLTQSKPETQRGNTQ